MCKMRCFQKNSVSLHSLRDVAQLVAHYVRDVGVASSNLVIPTLYINKRCLKTNQTPFFYSYCKASSILFSTT